MSVDVSARQLPAVLTDDQRRRLLRRALASALRAGRHVELVDAEAPTTERPVPQIAGGVAIALLFWALGATIGDQLHAAVWWWPLLAFGLAVAMVLLAGIPRLGPRLGPLLALVAILAAPLTFVVQVNEDRHALVTHVVPAVLTVAVALMTQSVNVRSARDVGVAAAAIARSAPLLAPLALVVLVLPALSADVWQAAASLDGFDLGVLVVVTVAPLLLLVMRQLASELAAVLETRAQTLARDADRDEVTRQMLRERLSPQAFDMVEFASADQMRSAWPERPEEYGPIIAAAEGDALRRPLQARLAMCVIVVGLVLTAYLYVVLATIIDPRVANAWSRQHVPTSRLDVLHVVVWFPGGIYLHVVGVLGVLATATFLAFALLEERFSTALADALLRLPADRLLALALPYLALREERLASDDDDLDGWDPGTVTPEEESSETETS
jgi:hypothetical protein